MWITTTAPDRIKAFNNKRRFPTRRACLKALSDIGRSWAVSSVTTIGRQPSASPAYDATLRKGTMMPPIRLHYALILDTSACPDPERAVQDFLDTAEFA